MLYEGVDVDIAGQDLVAPSAEPCTWIQSQPPAVRAFIDRRGRGAIAPSEDVRRLVQHMQQCELRHSSDMRCAYNTLTMQVARWTETPAYPTHILGPSFYAHLERDGQRVTMWGEVHDNMPGNTTASQCTQDLPASRPMHVHTFLANWFLRTAVPIDFYYEIYYKSAQLLAHRAENCEAFQECTPGYLSALETMLNTCTRNANKSECYFENVRVHGTDLERYNFGLVMPHHWQGRPIWMTPAAESHCNQVFSRARSSGGGWFDYEPTQRVKQSLTGAWIQLARDILLHPTEANLFRFVTPGKLDVVTYAFKKVIKNWDAMKATFGEWEKVEQELERAWSAQLLFWFTEYVKNGIEKESGYSSTGEELSGETWHEVRSSMLTLKANLSELFCMIYMDMYTLGRMLKGRPAPHIMFYGGAYHARIYTRVFKHLGFELKTLQNTLTETLDSDQPGSEPNVPCIPISMVSPALA